MQRDPAIKILSAIYEGGHLSVNMTDMASSLIGDDFFFVGSAFGDPMPGLKKRLRIRYEHDGRPYEDIVPERKMFVPRPFRVEGIPTEAEGFEIESAKFGADILTDFTDVARKYLVDPLEYCSIYNYRADNGPVSDPQPGVVKHYVVRFHYSGRTYISTMSEPNTYQKLLSPVFSVVIPTWNRWPFLKRCVDSVLAQDFDMTRVEIIVVDDGSTDDTPKVMEEICRENPRVAFVRIPHTGCCGLVRNYGFMISSGAYLAYLDSDDKFKPRHLSAAYERFQTTNALMLRVWNDFCTLKIGADGEIVETPEDDFNLKLFNRWSVYPSCIVHRRELLDALGRSVPFVVRRAGEDAVFLSDARRVEKSLGHEEEVVEEMTVTYGLIIGGNNLTYAIPEVKAEYQDRKPSSSSSSAGPS